MNKVLITGAHGQDGIILSKILLNLSDLINKSGIPNSLLL